MNEIIINDTYGVSDYEYLLSLGNRTLTHELVTKALVSIIFINDEEIKKINRDYRGLDKVTDVISFALEDNEEITSEIRVLGDIYISIPRMKEQALAYGHSEKRELAFLMVHGLLHLLGYDHTKGPKEEKEMFALQEELLNEEGIPR